MNILFLAPQPFYIVRGTPMAVAAACGVITEAVSSIDLVCYNEGENISTPDTTIYRIPNFRFLKNIPAGASFKKIICDFFLMLKVFSLIVKKGRKHYQLVHAVEESALIALLLKYFFKIPFVYDTDSHLTDQLFQKWPKLKCFYLGSIITFLEKQFIQKSELAIGVCPELITVAKNLGAKETLLLTDYSNLNESEIVNFNIANIPSDKNIRIKYSIPENQQIVLYVGNLEKYQGIDLLLESFELTFRKNNNIALVIGGGMEKHIKEYQNKISSWDSQNNIHFVGAVPLTDLTTFMMQANILAAPRILGGNTPMKLYSYLHAGKIVLATKISSHTQSINDTVAILVGSTAEKYSEGILEILNNPLQAEKIAKNARDLALKNYTYESFKDILLSAYQKLILNLKN